MKTRMIILPALLSAILWLTPALHSQMMSPQTLLRVDVPFGFVAGGMNLPAGEYEVLHVMNPSWISLKSSDHPAMATVFVHVSNTTAAGSTDKAVFNRYGDKYFLAQIWTAKDSQVHDCVMSSTEQAVAQNSAPETITVNAR